MMKKGIPGKHLRAFAVQEACMKVLGKGLGLALILLLIPLSATAFVPDGTHLVDLMVRAMGPAKKVRLDVQLEIQGADPAKPHLVQESLLFKVPEAFRSETEMVAVCAWVRKRAIFCWCWMEKLSEKHQGLKIFSMWCC